MNYPGDELLVQRCKKGQLEAYEKLIKKYENKVYSLCYRYSGNYDDANDLAQEAFIKVFNSIDKFKGKSAFSTWLYRVTANVCLDEMRKKKKTPISIDKPQETEEGEVYFNLPDQKYNPEIIAEKNDLKQLVHKGISKLPKEQRIIIILREMEELSYEEISEVLEISIGTVKSRLNRARKNLKEILSHNAELFPTNTHLKNKEV
ncbi:RNA polymerase sigma factor [Natranaerofaba carboxydovora]|uniref:RNA polymerase sigma factor n=1 Tax=Natranaerofaba carboxydovora TaxID=2742683 RepID=UPI001F129CA7|nr:sigma-70 family RNA polymerase sigma factor [Natranaerofaba carboxydovora]UMZ72559.1 ECF RNA polymerase sigma factor SigW [Natranaerofaba carboxydovora]